MSDEYRMVSKNQLVCLSRQNISDTVYRVSRDDNFFAPSSVTDAITAIITVIQNSYDESNGGRENPVQQILKIISSNSVPSRDMDSSKSGLASKPLLVQLFIIMHSVNKHGGDRGKKQVLWLAIAMHTAIILYYHDKTTLANQILMQFKLAIFFTTKNRRWIWDELSDYHMLINSNNKMRIKEVWLAFSEILNRIEQELYEVADRSAIDSIKKYTDPYLSEKKIQIYKILKAYESAFFPNIRKKSKPKKKKEAQVKVFNDEPIKLSNALLEYGPANEPVPYQWDTSKDDTEHYIPSFTTTFLQPEVEVYEGIAPSFEELIDSYDTPYINYQQLPNPLIRHSAPLQTIDLSIQQNYISQRELALNSNTRLLSLAGYQILFGALVSDASKNHKTPDKNSMCAAILLLSMITALPIDSLMTTGYVSGSKVFKIGDRRAYIQHELGITKRTESYDEQKYENQTDIIKIPVPFWSTKKVMNNEAPLKKGITDYIKSLRERYDFPYLSVARIESALHVVLSRYTPHSHSHIANIICRIPAPQAPAMYYSSHSSEELISHYKNALSVLNTNGKYDLSYVTPWHKYTVGSGFALKVEYVRDFMETLIQWVRASSTEEMHFDRVSIYTWFVFCLLTGVRPNNGIGKISDIDLNMGWLLIDDKPNKSVRSYRLVPLCFTLIKYLKRYQHYLIDYQLKHPLRLDINETVDQITYGNEVSLLRLLSKNHNEMILIKRGAVYEMTKELIDLSPYWTRHFVRTQLERQGVDIALINGVIGHEKNRQEALGKFSSLSKKQIKSVGKSFEKIAGQLGLSDDIGLPNWSTQGV